MKNYNKESITEVRSVLKSIQCDKCKKIIDPKNQNDFIDFQEMINISQTCGYGSIFGDMNTIEVDLCQNCFKEIMGDFIRIKE